MIKSKNNLNSSEVELKEHIDDKVTLIAEQYTDLNKKVDRLEKKIDN